MRIRKYVVVIPRTNEIESDSLLSKKSRTEEGEARRLTSDPHRQQSSERRELILQILLRDAPPNFRASDVNLGHLEKLKTVVPGIVGWQQFEVPGRHQKHTRKSEGGAWRKNHSRLKLVKKNHVTLNVC